MTKKNDINNEFNTENKITKQKVFSFLCYLLFVFDIFFLIWNIFHCTNMIYPHLSMGIDVFNWKEQYKINLIFFAIIFGFPNIAAINYLIYLKINNKR